MRRVTQTLYHSLAVKYRLLEYAIELDSSAVCDQAVSTSPAGWLLGDGEMLARRGPGLSFLSLSPSLSLSTAVCPMVSSHRYKTSTSMDCWGGGGV